MIRRFLCALSLAVAVAGSASVVARQQPDPVVKARVQAFIGALAQTDPVVFERMAQEQFAPEFLARRNADERRSLFQRIHSDFGELSLAPQPDGDNQAVTLEVKSATGPGGEIRLSFDPNPPRKIVGIGVGIGGPGGSPNALPPPPINSTMSAAELARALDGYVAPLVQADRFAGVVLVARDGATQYQQAFGLADRDKKIANTIGTRFSLGSINKIFTKTALGQLVAQGKLSLTDTLGTLLPDYPNEMSKRATVDQLLNHQAGIADFFGTEFEARPKSEFRSNADYYRLVSHLPPAFEPGKANQYCNGCYIVLGAIIEKVSGTRYEDYITEHVFKPAGMKTAGFFQSDRLPGETALGYTMRLPEARGQLRSNVTVHGAAGSAAGGAYATVADLLAFDNALRERRLLDAKTTAWVLESDDQGPRVRGGLGVAGGAPGVNALLEANGTWTVVVLANLDPPAAELLGTAIRKRLVR